MSRISTDEYVAGIRGGDRVILGRAITLIESTRPEDRQQGDDLIEACLEHAAASIRTGITGPPGVGKSTFIEALGLRLVENDRRVAVLAVDPSSRISGGSILGDKTRMHRLAASPAAFVRPSPGGETAGGVALRTREVIILCEAAGFDTIFVETIGAGQAEASVRSVVDFLLLLAPPDAGDELQGIKRGIIEMADAVVVTKADGTNAAGARRTRALLIRALELFPDSDTGWKVPVHICSSLTGEGLDEVLGTISEFETIARSSGRLEVARREQRRCRLLELVRARLVDALHADPRAAAMLAHFEQLVADRQISASAAADAVVEAFRCKEVPGSTSVRD